MNATLGERINTLLSAPVIYNGQRITVGEAVEAHKARGFDSLSFTLWLKCNYAGLLSGTRSET
jgi:hypothetical protein